MGSAGLGWALWTISRPSLELWSHLKDAWETSSTSTKVTVFSAESFLMPQAAEERFSVQPGPFTHPAPTSYQCMGWTPVRIITSRHIYKPQTFEYFGHITDTTFTRTGFSLIFSSLPYFLFLYAGGGRAGDIPLGDDVPITTTLGTNRRHTHETPHI